MLRQPVRFTVVVANPKPASCTLALATSAADELAATLGLKAGYEVIDLPALSRRLLLPEPSAAVEDALDQVMLADLLLVATPVLHGSYSGLLKVFCDRLPAGALRGAAGVPVVVTDSPQYAGAAETQLRHLLAELGASVPVAGLAVAESDPERSRPVLAEWARRAAQSLGAVEHRNDGIVSGNDDANEQIALRHTSDAARHSTVVLPRLG
jgi:FMN reductase